MLFKSSPTVPHRASGRRQARPPVLPTGGRFLLNNESAGTRVRLAPEHIVGDVGQQRRTPSFNRTVCASGTPSTTRRMKKTRPKAIRQTQAQRRKKTQGAILSASLRLLAQSGYAGFSASRVASMAGVSSGAQEHYFPTKNSLIAAATQFAMVEAVEHARRLAQTATKSADPISKFLADSEHFFFTPVFQAMAEIMIAGRSDRALARIVNPIVLDARQALNGIWTDTLGAAGHPR
jgi:AcrR family transcriptional regulator